MHDHNAPKLHDLVSFCEQASAWLDRHKDNVVAVHCQGGKGRTGTFCAALQMWTDFKHCAKASLDYFAQRRTDWRQGTKLVQVSLGERARAGGQVVRNDGAGMVC